MILCIYGAGSHGRVTADLARAMGCFADILFVDDDETKNGQTLDKLRIVAPLEILPSLLKCEASIVVAAGHPIHRSRMVSKAASLGLKFANVIHPSAQIAASAVIGTGNTIGAACVINTGARLGNHNLINTSVVIEHDCLLGDGNNLCPGALLGGGTKIGNSCFIGSRALLQCAMKVEDRAVVAAGTLAYKDVPEGTYWRGSPAALVGTVADSVNWRHFL